LKAGEEDALENSRSTLLATGGSLDRKRAPEEQPSSDPLRGGHFHTFGTSQVTEDIQQGGRRKEPRFSITANGTIAKDVTGVSEVGSVVNVSARGVMLHVPVRPAIDIGCRVWIHFLGTVGLGIVRHVSSARYGFFVGIELSGD
jgi:hypothetical protein